MIALKKYTITLFCTLCLGAHSAAYSMKPAEAADPAAAIGAPSVAPAANAPVPQIFYIQAPQQKAHEPNALTAVLSDGRFQAIALCVIGLGVVRQKFPGVWGWGGDLFATVFNRGPLKRLNEQVHALGIIAKQELGMLFGIRRGLDTMQKEITAIKEAQTADSERLTNMSSQLDELTKKTTALSEATALGQQDTQTRLAELASNVKQIKKEVAEMYSAFKGRPKAITDGTSPSSSDQSTPSSPLALELPTLMHTNATSKPRSLTKNNPPCPGAALGWPIVKSKQSGFGQFSRYGVGVPLSELLKSL